MKNKLVLFLISLVIALVIVNVAVLGLLMKRGHAPDSGSAARPAPVSAPDTAVAVPSGIPGMTGFAENDSIGVRAGKTVNELRQKSGETYGTVRQKTEETYGVVSEKTRQTAEDLKKSSEETLVILKEKAAKASGDLRVAYEKVVADLNREIQKFNETLKNQTS